MTLIVVGLESPLPGPAYRHAWIKPLLTVSIGSAFSFDDLCRVRVLDVPMLISMMFCGLRGVMLRVRSMAMGCVGMIRAFFMVTVLVVFGRGAMVLGRVFVVLRGFVMMIDVVFGHGILSWCWA